MGGWGVMACPKSGSFGVSGCERNCPVFYCQEWISELFQSRNIPTTDLSHCSSFPPAPLKLLAGSREGSTLLSAVHTKASFSCSSSKRGTGERWGMGVNAVDTPLRLSSWHLKKQHKSQKERENTQTSWNNICWVNVWRTWRNWLDIVQFCFKGNPGLNQGTKFIGVGGRTGKHFVMEAGKLFSRSEGKRLKEELVFFTNKLKSGKIKDHAISSVARQETRWKLVFTNLECFIEWSCLGEKTLWKTECRTGLRLFWNRGGVLGGGEGHRVGIGGHRGECYNSRGKESCLVVTNHCSLLLRGGVMESRKWRSLDWKLN